MGLISDVLALLRPPAPVEGEPEPEMPTVERLRAALDQMALELADAERLIADAPQRRTELLMKEGTDAAIRRLEQSVERAHLQRERIETLRPELEVRIRAMQDESRADAWLEFRSRLVEQLEACALAREEADRHAARLFGLKLEASNAGYRVETDLVPWHCGTVPAGGFADMAVAMARVKAFTAAESPLWNVRFLAWTSVALHGGRQLTGYLQGQEAGFDAETARMLIEGGHAVLNDPKKLPPAPPPKPKRHHTRDELLRLEEVQSGGRRTVTGSNRPPVEPARAWTRLNSVPGEV